MGVGRKGELGLLEGVDECLPLASFMNRVERLFAAYHCYCSYNNQLSALHLFQTTLKRKLTEATVSERLSSKSRTIERA